jgi:hypothetical protein
MLALSKITGKTYDTYDVIRILNPQQAIFYMKNNVQLQDVEFSKNRFGKDIFVFLFNRKDTVDAFDLWCRRKDEQ